MEFISLHAIIVVAAAAISLGLRLHEIGSPNHVCWDEVHFGKHASHYINRTLFFDVHPPLGKLILAISGYLTGYKGEAAFDKPGDSLEHIEYVGMRQAAALFGSAVVPIAAAIVWELSTSTAATLITSVLLLSDTALTVTSRFILLDPFMLFFILFSSYCYIKHSKSRAFEWPWWVSLCGCGTSLACAVGVKFVGLFIIAHIGLCVANDLWHIVGLKELPLEKVVQHFLARVYTLICLPALVYCFIYVLHFLTLNKSGKGDGFYSSAYQTTVIGNPLYHIKMPEYLAFDSEVTLKNYRTNGGYLHSHIHLYPKENVQQVTSYMHKDPNNNWIVRRSGEDEGADSALHVRDGDIVRLEHKKTGKFLHCHDVSASLTRGHRLVSGSSQNEADADHNLFKIQMVHGHQSEERITPIFSIFQLVHVNQQCIIESKGKQLPKWAKEQKEVTCNPDLSATSNALWNIENLYDGRLPDVRLDWKEARPGFISKLVETHLVMFANNRDLKPKPESDFLSRPWMWPLAYRGQLFSVQPHIMMLGNPLTHWLILVLLLPCLLLFINDMVRNQRAKAFKQQDVNESLIDSAPYSQLGWLLLAWVLHYAPFWAMTRVVYPHHYQPAYIFSCMFTGVSVDHLTRRLSRWLPLTLGSVLRWTIISVICVLSIAR